MITKNKMSLFLSSNRDSRVKYLQILHNLRLFEHLLRQEVSYIQRQT